MAVVDVRHHLVRGGVLGRFGGVAVVAAAAACGHTATPAAGMAAPTGGDAVESFLARLIAGDRAALLAGFAGEPAVDDPMGGRVRGRQAFEAYAAERSAWLQQRGARLSPLRTTRDGRRTVTEAVVALVEPGRSLELPIAVIGDREPDGRARAIRVYHSSWPLEGKHHVRSPVLPRDPNAHVTGVVAEYQRALAVGDLEAILRTFEPDGYFREPSGGPYVHRGPTELRKFMAQILSAGGIGLEHASVTDDGVVTAIEFNAVSFGPRALKPQAGLAIYERGVTGRIAAARIYDDVNVEELAPGGALQ